MTDVMGFRGWTRPKGKLSDYDREQEKLREAGFSVIEESVRSQWNPEEEDLAAIPVLAKSLLA